MSEHEHESYDEGDFRVTAPMQAYTTGEVTVGVVVLIVGAVVVFGIPLLFA
ncbi:MAG: hypothetical protein ABEJ28_00740 [Salinigranum sp.]